MFDWKKSRFYSLHAPTEMCHTHVLIISLASLLISADAVKIDTPDINALLQSTPTLVPLFEECHAIDGIGNNRANPRWGSSGTPLARRVHQQRLVYVNSDTIFSGSTRLCGWHRRNAERQYKPA